MNDLRPRVIVSPKYLYQSLTTAYGLVYAPSDYLLRWKLASKYPTNVVKLAQAVKRRDGRKVPQVVHYAEGVGAGNRSRISGILGRGLGLGLDEDIRVAYTFLALNYEFGDEVFLFGFSRGAYTVRSLAGLIHCCGLVGRQHMRSISDAFELYRDRSVSPGSARARRFRKEHGDRIV